MSTLGRRVGDRTTTQAGNSLRLLPSGPDRVGEGPVRRRPPASLYQVPARPRQVSQPRRGSASAWRNQPEPDVVGFDDSERAAAARAQQRNSMMPAKSKAQQKAAGAALAAKRG